MALAVIAMVQGWCPGILLMGLVAVEIRHAALRLLLQMPLLGEGTGDLERFDRIEWLLQNEESIAAADLLKHLVPRVIRLRGAKHDLERRSISQIFCVVLHAVAPGRHPRRQTAAAL
jgi:hypothetical protein